MTSAQQAGQAKESEEFEASREYKCPDCGGPSFYMGIDFKAPKRADVEAWREAKAFIESGKVYHRGGQ